MFDDGNIVDVGAITTRGLPASARLDLARRIVARFWNGLPAEIPEAALVAVEQRIGAGLPMVLREGYRSLLTAHGMNAQDRFLALDDLVVDSHFMRIRIENQGCVEWAARIDAVEPDPIVWSRPLGGSWQRDAGSVSSFLVAAALQEAIWAPQHCANSAMDGEHESLLRVGFRRIDIEAFDLWSDPTLQCSFYGGPDTLVADVAGSWMFAACLTSQALVQLTSSVPAEWVLN